MNPLPFEHDSLELLEACALALLPLRSVPEAQAHRAQEQQAASKPSAGTVWHRLPGGSPIIERSGSHPASAFDPVAAEPLPLQSAGLTIEEISRTVERDARRFEKY